MRDGGRFALRTGGCDGRGRLARSHARDQLDCCHVEQRRDDADLVQRERGSAAEAVGHVLLLQAQCCGDALLGDVVAAHLGADVAGNCPAEEAFRLADGGCGHAGKVHVSVVLHNVMFLGYL